MEPQLVGIQDTLYAIAFMLGAILFIVIVILWEVTKDGRSVSRPDGEIDNPGTDTSVSALGMPGERKRLVLHHRTIYPPGATKSLLDRQRKKEDNQ